MNTISIAHGNALIVAHRGLSGLEKENTAAAFVAAGNRSYWGVETDVHRTADGNFILIHDNNTKRLAALEPPVVIEQTDFDTLREIVLRDIDGNVGRIDLRMPTLQEYIGICKKYNKICVLELKNLFSEEDICRIVEVFREAEYLHNAVFIAFDMQNLIYLRRHYPDLPAQQLSGTLDEELFERIQQHKLDLDVYYKVLTEEWVKRVHDAGLKVNCWTVDDPKEAEKLISWGVDYITTNILE